MKKRIPIILGIILVCIAVWLLITSNPFIRQYMERFDHIGYDLQLRTRMLAHPQHPETPIAIIDIDDKSLSAEGHWPWPREKLAQLVDLLNQQGASVIVFDEFFSEKEQNIAEMVLNKLKNQSTHFDSVLKNNLAAFDQDSKFANSLKNTSSVLAIGFLPRKETENTLPKPLFKLTPVQKKYLDIYEASGFISNIPVLQNAAKGHGFINIFPDSDGIIRHAPLLMAYQSNVYPSLALQAVLSYLNESAQIITPSYGSSIELEGINIGPFSIPTNAASQVLIPFIGKSYTFPYYSATDVLHGKIPKESIEGKILFIGTSATGLGDLKATAIQNPFPGVEIQATITNGILTNNFSYIPAWTFGANVSITILFGLVGAFAFPYFGPRSLGLIIVLLPTAMLFINNWIWSKTGLVLSFFVPVILIMVMAVLNILYGYLFETRKREHLKEIFGQYVPEKHIDEMLKTSDSYAMHGEDREMSVLFADIRGFTTISEGMSAENLVEMLNTFFTPMTEIIFKHHGTIDKYVGDLIMAFWGAPLKDKRHAQHAIESALDMQSRLDSLRRELESRNWPPIHIGIGVNSGHMSVGDMGSQFRRNYTVLGDAVNLGSRVEGLTKFYGVDIIATENSVKDQNKFTFRKLDRVAVKGKKEGVEIYEVIGEKSDVSDEMKKELQQYNQALEAYFNQQWDAALASMQTLHQAHPETKVYKLYVERINHIKSSPPSKGWDGIYRHTTK